MVEKSILQLTHWLQFKEKEMSKETIKSILREGVEAKNILGVEVTRPNQELIVMRGIPGSNII